MNRRWVIGAVVAALVVVGVLVGVSLANRGGDDDKLTSVAPASVEEVQGLLAGIPQKGNVLGEADAPVTITEFGDIACPACKAASETVIPELITRYVKPGRVKMVFRPVAIVRPQDVSEVGALGAEAAADQNAMWSFSELLYRNQGDEQQDWLTEEGMRDAVSKLGLDVDAWNSSFAGSGVADRFIASRDAFISQGLQATPTFVIEGPAGTQAIEGAGSMSDFETALQRAGLTGAQ